MIELIILKLFLRKRETFEKYVSLVENSALETTHKIILRTIKNYYATFPDHTYIAQDEFKSFFAIEFPPYAKKEEYQDLIDVIYAQEVSNDVALEYIKKLVRKTCAAEICNKLIPIISEETDNLDFGDLEETIKKYQDQLKEQEEPDSIIFDKSLEAALAQRAEDGLSWRLSLLQEALGPLPGGSHGHVFARPETGKTSFLHSELTNFAEQLAGDACILWFNNEEAPNKILIRQHCAMLGKPEEEILADVRATNEEFLERGGSRIHLITKDILTLDEIEKLCVEYRPRVVAIDQGDKISFRGEGRAGNGADRLKMLYDKIRAMIIRMNEQWKIDCITVGQADAAAEGKRWLYQSNLDSGKTGKPGAFDYIIGIGKEHGDSENRYINICKNKQKAVPPEKLRGVVVLDRYSGRYIG